MRSTPLPQKAETDARDVKTEETPKSGLEHARTVEIQANSRCTPHHGLAVPISIPDRAVEHGTDKADVSSLDVEAPASGPREVDNPAVSALQLLLRVEGEAREATSLRELRFLLANETRKLTRARQIFLVERRRPRSFAISAISSLPTVDRNVPLNQAIEELIGNIEPDSKLNSISEFDASQLRNIDRSLKAYPLKHLLWVPLLTRSGSVFAGLLLARENPWQERDAVVSSRLAATYGHAWQALVAGQRTPHVSGPKMRWGLAAVLAVLAALIVPVPMSALAPAEVVAGSPSVIAVPIDGAIDKILVEPNAVVKSGQPLFSLVDTALRNKLKISEREVQVARAKLKRANLLAFFDDEGRRQLGIANAELELKLVERDYARDLLKKTVVRAEQDGIAVYRDKKELVGKPVSVGQKIMELADPSRILLRIDMPVADGALLKTGAPSRFFSDSSPLRPVHGSVLRADYRARVDETNSMSFRAWAELELDPGGSRPRLGTRGTAQVFGDNVPLGVYLFRRPLSAARQWLGI